MNKEFNKKSFMKTLTENGLNPSYQGSTKTIFVDLPEGKTTKDMGISTSIEEHGFVVKDRPIEE